MTMESIWTGPALMNPANRRRMTFVVTLVGQDPALAESLYAGKIPAQTSGVTLHGRNGAKFVGDIEISDFVTNPFDKTAYFHLREYAPNGGDAWRVSYEVNVRSKIGLAFVTPIDIAPA